MNWQTSPLLIRLRSVLRSLGLTRLLRRFAPATGYEAGFDRRLVTAIRPGDCIWDIGANVGHYAMKFAAATGPDGRVVAFEPSPANRAQLVAAVNGHPAITVRAEALGAEPGRLVLAQGDDPLGATSRVTADGDGIAVEAARGDALAETQEAPMPNVIKIDTEGFELEVLTGLEGLLRDDRLRVVGIEVHFGILAERGMASAPAEIEAKLSAAGFATAWTDASHIVGERQGCER